jgi:hypothetical protein
MSSPSFLDFLEVDTRFLSSQALQPSHEGLRRREIHGLIRERGIIRIPGQEKRLDQAPEGFGLGAPGGIAVAHFGKNHQPVRYRSGT